MRAVVAYDGTPFHGFAANPGVRTVSGDLGDALQQVLRSPVTLTCAGRTDTGVHAWGQVVSFDVPAGTDLTAVQTSVNRICGPTLVLRSLTHADPDFDARSCALSRSYRYSLLLRPVPDPFLAATTWHVARPLAVEAMNEAAACLLGEHDFSSFCRRQHATDGTEKSRTRVVHEAQWQPADADLLRFHVTASSFCQQMVRSLTGTLVEIGLGRRPPTQLAAILAARDRSAAGQLAPPHGLCLWSVAY